MGKCTEAITSMIIRAASACIPKSSRKKGKMKWFHGGMNVKMLLKKDIMRSEL